MHGVMLSIRKCLFIKELMGKQIFYNIILNIGILVLAYCSIAAFNEKQYGIIAAFVLGIAVLIYLKIKLAKKVKQLLQERKK